MSTICFQTSCYQKSYRHLLDGQLYKYLALFPNTPFKEKQLIVNNLIDSVDFSKVFKNFNVYYSDNNIDNILHNFGINLNSYTKDNLYYSIQHFVGIFNTTCDYIFHVSEDCNIDNLDDKFIEECIHVLDENSQYICASPNWIDCLNLGGKQEAQKEINNFYVCKGFTDQVYIIKAKEFKQKIYNFIHNDSNRYPDYGGQAFEKRINSWMQCCNLYRIVHNKYYYLPGFYDKEIKGF